ncbi:MAG: VapE domain-containing protein [Bacteroidaceae bacterium]|nr:DUF3874 domain-containing protein [Bacteroidaceae bacterium]
MRITRSKKNGETYTKQPIELETAIELLRHEIKTKPVSTLRENLRYVSSNHRNDAADKIPILIFGCALGNSSSIKKAFVYNGLITLEVNHLTDIKEACEVRKRASELPQTMIAFIGSGARSVKIIIPFISNKDTLPQDRNQATYFHAQAYREAIKYYQPQLHREISTKEPVPEYAVRQSFDPDLYYNPGALSIRIDQPIQMPGKETYEEARQTIEDPMKRILPGYERYDRIATLFDFAYWDAISELKGTDNEKDRLPFFIRLAERCFQSGIPEEDAVRWTIFHEDLHPLQTEIRFTFRDVYNTKILFGSKPFIPKSLMLIARLEEFLRRRYRLRRNVIMNATEFMEQNTLTFHFESVTKQTINSIVINAHYEGIEVWDADVKRYLESDRVPVYNPVEEYLHHLPAWDKKDRIGALADRLPCDDPDVWRMRFHRWFLSMVVHWLGVDKKHANSAMPLLVGDQGTMKSTFCSELLPPQLVDYYTDSFNISKRQDAMLALTRFLLINIDEFDSLKPSHQGFLKHIVQKPVVQEKLPYGSQTLRMRRYATFIATSNNFDLLNDPTGSRRFLCIEIKGVLDHKLPIDYEQLYSQAVAEINEGARYWFTREEELQITNDNRKFQTVSLEEDSFRSYFRKPEQGEDYEELLCVEILERIKKYQRGFDYSSTMAMRLGRLLSAEFTCRRAHRGKSYQVIDMHLDSKEE